MITLDKKQKVILSYFRDGKSKKAICRDEKIHWKTLNRYITEYQKYKNELLANGEVSENEIIEKIVEKPKYDASNRQKRKLEPEIVEKVKECLLANEVKRQQCQHKQQMKKIDIHEYLIDQGYNIGYTTICNLVRNLEKSTKEAYIKQEYNLGDVCEFDWGEVKLFIAQKLVALQMAAFTSACGNYRYARLYYKQDTSSFQNSHSYFFKHINGVYKTMVYDNMKVAVKKFVGHSEKEATDGLLKLSIYYNFAFRFCNIASGNEKGHVEKSVEYIRRKAFCKIDSFNNIEEANAHLLNTCIKLNNRPQQYNSNKTASQILEEERPFLLPDMPLFECPHITESRVDKYSTITIDTCHYSVPDIYVGKMVLTKKYTDRIVCYYENELIASHKRLFGFAKWKLELKHYLRTLKMKPGALKDSKVFSQSLLEIQDIYLNYYQNAPKDFIELMQYMNDKNVPLKKILHAIEQVKKITPKDINTAKIKVLCERKFVNNISDSNDLSNIELKSKEQLNLITSLFPGSNNTKWAGEII